MCRNETEMCFHFWQPYSVQFWVFLLQRIMGRDQYDTEALDTKIDIASFGPEADEWNPFILAMTPQIAVHIQYQQSCDASLYLVITV